MPNFRDNEDLHKLDKEYLNASLCKFVVYSLQHSETSDISHVFLPLTTAELSTLKQVRFFWPTLYIMHSILFVNLFNIKSYSNLFLNTVLTVYYYYNTYNMMAVTYMILGRPVAIHLSQMHQMLNCELKPANYS